MTDSRSCAGNVGLVEALRGLLEIEEARIATGAFKPNAEARQRIDAARSALRASQPATPTGGERSSAGIATLSDRIEDIICGGNCTHPEICDGTEVTWCGKRTEELLALIAPAQPSRNDALSALAGLFSESAHETWTKGEIINIIEDAIRLGSPHSSTERKLHPTSCACDRCQGRPLGRSLSSPPRETHSENSREILEVHTVGYRKIRGT